MSMYRMRVSKPYKPDDWYRVRVSVFGWTGERRFKTWEKAVDFSKSPFDIEEWVKKEVRKKPLYSRTPYAQGGEE